LNFETFCGLCSQPAIESQFPVFVIPTMGRFCGLVVYLEVAGAGFVAKENGAFQARDGAIKIREDRRNSEG
jgi:hypothetical protein